MASSRVALKTFSRTCRGNHVSRARYVNGLRVRNDGQEMLYCLFGDHVR
ncbi:Uncharacterised protein [Mycobacteroides abscessus subsp. abscessus]|nr:Uncharacterised protein [Mycobacteroides abscessus subsp. abscessus]